MDTLTAINSWNVHDKLSSARNGLTWDYQTQNWESYDGHWYTLSPTKLATLEQSLELFIECCKIGVDIQWIIAKDTTSLLKNILSHPAPDFTHDIITSHAWQLIFNLVIANTKNQSRIWQELAELLVHYLQTDFRYKDTCRLILFNIYSVGKLAQSEGTRMLKILLNSFHQEMHLERPKRQGLNMFLEHFIIDENNISPMYLKLNTSEKLWILQFTISHIKQGHFTVLPISMDLLYRVCDEFKSKSEYIFNTGVRNDFDLQEVVALFLVIAAAASERYYELNRADVQLFIQIGKLLQNVLYDEGYFEKAFLSVNRESGESLKGMLLTTISNFVKDSKVNKDMARENGVIDCVLNIIATEGTNPLMYRSCIFTLIDICQSNALNKEHTINLATTKKNPHLSTVLIDINYKRKN